MFIMKKIIAITLAVLMAVMTFAFAGCGDKKTATDSDLEYVKNNGKLVIGITDFDPMDYKDANGAWQWQNGKTQEQFEETYGTLDSWHEQYTDWYYMIYTGELGGYSAYNMFRSHDLNDWKPCGRAYNTVHDKSYTQQHRT